MKLQIASIGEARGRLADPTRLPTHVVSIQNDFDPPLAEAVALPPGIERAFVHFNDTIGGAGGPEERHVEAILAFGTSIDETSDVLVHCHAGCSRSSAAAILLAWQERIRPVDMMLRGWLAIGRHWPNAQLISVATIYVGREIYTAVQETFGPDWGARVAIAGEFPR